MNFVQQEIVRVAQHYLDIKEVGANNSGFNDKEFEQRIEAVGWNHGQAWCAYFAELVWREAYSKFDTTIANRIGTLFSSGAVSTYQHFEKADDFTVQQTPIVGAVVIWQHYKNNKPTWMGHAGIVTSGNSDSIHTIEGNTNKAGDREGQGVESKIRSLITVENPTRLQLLGFIVPKDWIS